MILYCFFIAFLNHWGLLGSIPSHDPSFWVGKRVVLTGVVISPPDKRPKGLVLTLQVETIMEWEPTKKMGSVSGRVLLHVMGKAPKNINPGDRLRVVGRLQKPTDKKIPGTFDYTAYLKNKNIHCLLFTGSRQTTNLGPSHQKKLLRWGWNRREKIVSVFKKYLNEEEATVISGLVVGERPRFHPYIRKIFIESGTMHILVASGSNVAFVIGVWFLLARFLFHLTRKIALATSLLGVWCYVLIVGADAPIFRAGVMSTVGILAYLMAREDRAYHALALAALSLLLPSPKTLFDVGFQMSFVTAFGMIYFLPRIDPLFRSFSTPVLWIFRLMAATLTAQLWLAPITALVFKRFFPISLFSNILVMPLSGVGLLAGFGLVGMEIVQTTFPFLSFLVVGMGYLVHLYLQTLIGLVHFFAHYPGTSIWISPPHWSWILGYYLVLFCVVGIGTSIRSRLGCALGLGLMILSTFFLGCKSVPQNQVTLTWIDVGRRHSLLLEIPKTKPILINPGPNEPFDSAERIILPYLTERRIKELEAIVITHTDPNRVSSLPSLWRTLGKPAVIICLLTGGEDWEAWKERNPNIPMTFLRENKFLQWSNFRLKVLPVSKAFKSETLLLLT
ncbi:hypothetical protein BVX98_07105 [bacterium F11]|nr:hypothetical protein BVX98_07105 [bacterium F11]